MMYHSLGSGGVVACCSCALTSVVFRFCKFLELCRSRYSQQSVKCRYVRVCLERKVLKVDPQQIGQALSAECICAQSHRQTQDSVAYSTSRVSLCSSRQNRGCVAGEHPQPRAHDVAQTWQARMGHRQTGEAKVDHHQ
eukprot:3312352-Amphidinium_carterae.1